MTYPLNEQKIAIAATDGFEESELMRPKEALEEAGVKTSIISLELGSIKGWSGGNWGKSIEVDQTFDHCGPEDFDALLLPGGVMNPDTLRMQGKAVDFVKAFGRSGKPIAAICHAPWILIEADLVRGKRLTSWPSLKKDLINAGAEWVDQPVVDHDGLITSRNPNDLPAFIHKFMEVCVEDRYARA